ncbi:MAG: hypothetical protein JXA57_15660 [Armatimonadetes bacterium]|nr:hypothetical protein [Armatimonadota bacterium]
MNHTIQIVVDQDRRLVVDRWENDRGSRFVTVAPEFKDRSGRWRLAHSGLILAPAVVRELAPALLTTAATIEASPDEPQPTQAHRDSTRWP